MTFLIKFYDSLGNRVPFLDATHQPNTEIYSVKVACENVDDLFPQFIRTLADEARQALQTYNFRRG